MTWDVLLSGLIGAAIGGVFSIIGSLWATKSNIKSQREETELIAMRNLKLSAGIIYNDIISLLKEMVYMSNAEPIKNMGFGSHNSRYADHVANLKDKLSPDEQYALHYLYGLLMKFQGICQIETHNLSELAAYEMSLGKVFERFCRDVYGNTENFRIQSGNLSLQNFQIDYALRTMEPPFKNLFNTLDELRK